MELVFHWFWLVKIVFLVIGLTLAWKYYKTRKNVYGILLLVYVVIMIINPIKLKPNTTLINTMTNTKIEQSKVLPDKIEDKSFDIKKQVQGIVKEDLE